MFSLLAKLFVTSELFALVLILADKLSVSLPMRLLNILAVSDNFNFVNCEESV